jgi:hypothetical protein
MANEFCEEQTQLQASTGVRMYAELSVHGCRFSNSLIQRLGPWTKLDNGVKIYRLDETSPLSDAEQQLCEAARSHVARSSPSNASFEAKYRIGCATAVLSHSACMRFAAHLVALSSREHLSRGWDGPGPFQSKWHQERFERYGPHDMLAQSTEQRAWRRMVAERFTDEAKQPSLVRGHRMCPWVRVLTVFHVCTYEQATNICRSGFAALATRNSGYYGQGL